MNDLSRSKECISCEGDCANCKISKAQVNEIITNSLLGAMKTDNRDMLEAKVDEIIAYTLLSAMKTDEDH